MSDGSTIAFQGLLRSVQHAQIFHVVRSTWQTIVSFVRKMISHVPFDRLACHPAPTLDPNSISPVTHERIGLGNDAIPSSVRPIPD